ncbi:hypothetical protein QL285_002803 [Trifolium repens]|nr:hypothetical protein QL285_036321 [Trifolium repens]KAK2455341.1 hypothetical protein QL285_002803 [Trifolium repens]
MESSPFGRFLPQYPNPPFSRGNSWLVEWGFSLTPPRFTPSSPVSCFVRFRRRPSLHRRDEGFRSVEICRDQSFQSASAMLENLGRTITLVMARSGLVLVAALASCRWVSLSPCWRLVSGSTLDLLNCV